MLKQTTTALAALALLSLPLAAQQNAGAGGDFVPSLSVSGSGEARVAPDEATVRLGVLSQAPTARGAQEQVSRTAGAILDAIRKLGVAPEKLQTSELNLSPLYSQGRPEGESREPRITGYQASNVVSVQLEDLAKVGPVIDAGLAAGANRLDGVTFGLRDDAAARATALRNAVAEARAKAEALADALRVRLVEIIEVAEGGVSVSPPPYLRSRAMMAEASMADTPVSAGQVGVEGMVTVRYRIAPCPGQGPCR